MTAKPTITSSSNPRIKRIAQLCQRAKSRRREGLFVVEGKKMFQEAPPEWVREVYLSESLAASDPELAEQAMEFPCEIASDAVFRQISDTVTPQGVLVLLAVPEYSQEKVLSGDGLYVVLEDLQDPGNMGTILRTAEGAGVDGILLTKGCVDLFNPKVVRATMGSIYRMPFLFFEDIDDAAKALKEAGIRTYAAHLAGSRSYDEISYKEGAAFLIGNEGNGLSEKAGCAADTLIRIPMLGKVE